jgi:ribose/xylose/arabinose/galactoside ABC-type transport system permease subunit
VTATNRQFVASTRDRAERNRKFVPLSVTFLLFGLFYLGGLVSFSAMQSGQAFFNLLDSAPFLICTVVGETLVIVSGGIDLSVSGILALSTVVAASLVNEGWSPWAAFAVCLGVGMLFGLVQGYFITYLKVQPFIATLAGMWLARGLCYVISDQEVRIHDATYTTLNQTKVLIPILSDPHNPDTWSYVTYPVLAAMALFVFGLYVVHFTRFGRTIYAIGGGNGANEASARMMGLPVNRTKVLVYVFSGFCSALAGILYSIYVGSGHGSHGNGFELTTIAAAVIGGVALTGGAGYLIGALVGVLMTSLIQALIQYQGNLLSYWVYIVIGAMMLVFIGIQSLVQAWNDAAVSRARTGIQLKRRPVAWYKRAYFRYPVGAVVIVAIVGSLAYLAAPFVFPKAQTITCTRQPMRAELTQSLAAGDAVVVYERNGGTKCVDEVFAIYPDGRVTVDFSGNAQPDASIPVDKLQQLLVDINNYGWFTDEFVTTYHTPCGACYQYDLTVKYNGQTKQVSAVDGGVDAFANWWQITPELSRLLPEEAD